MKWSFAIIGVFILGIIGVSIILLFQNITTNNENDYYLLKEVTEAAMLDSIDISYYRDSGNLKIIKEKFVENFTRRFAESTLFITEEYRIEFYDIMEIPPKVSIIIKTDLGEYTVAGNADEYGIANKLDAILEYTGKNTNATTGITESENPYVSKSISMDYYAILNKGDNTQFSLKTPDVLNVLNIKNIKVKSVTNVGIVKTQGELNQALMRYPLLYNIDSKDDNKYYLQSINDFDEKVSSVSYQYHNCSSGSGGYNCDDDNKYYVKIKANFSDKVVLKYKVTWSYDEYEFAN